MATGQQQETELGSIDDDTKWIEDSLSHLLQCLKDGRSASVLREWPKIPDILDEKELFAATIKSFSDQWDTYWESCAQLRGIDVQKAIIQIEKLTSKSSSAKFNRVYFHTRMPKDPVFVTLRDIWKKLSTETEESIDMKTKESTITEYSCLTKWFLAYLQYLVNVLYFESETYFVEDMHLTPRPPQQTDEEIILSVKKIALSWQELWSSKMSSDDQETVKYTEAIHHIFVSGIKLKKKHQNRRKLKNIAKYFINQKPEKMEKRCESTRKKLPEDLNNREDGKCESELKTEEEFANLRKAYEDEVEKSEQILKNILKLVNDDLPPEEHKKSFHTDEALKELENQFRVLKLKNDSLEREMTSCTEKVCHLQEQLDPEVKARKAYEEEVQKSEEILINILKFAEVDLPSEENRKSLQTDEALKALENRFHILKSKNESLKGEITSCKSNAEENTLRLQEQLDQEVKTSDLNFKFLTMERLLTAFENNTMTVFDEVGAELESCDEKSRKRLQKWYQRVRKRLESMLLEKDQNQRKIAALKHMQAELEESKDQLLNRLSQVAGAKLKENNPNITDLSDPNRPLKLAEQFSELYDKEWTNALEELGKDDTEETTAIGLLLESITKCYQFCLRNSSGSLRAFLMCEELDWRNELDADENHLLSETRKSLAKVHIRQIKQRFLKEKIIKTKKSQKNLRYFIEKSLELSWYMVIQSPPIHMEVNFPKGAPLVKSTLKEYTISGDIISYLVWPPLYLHKDGPLLSKGVAQPHPKPRHRRQRQSKDHPSFLPK